MYAQDIADTDSIIVYGPAFEAFTAMGQLEAAGVAASKLKHWEPCEESPADDLSALLHDVAPLAGVALPESIQVSVTWLCSLSLP